MIREFAKYWPGAARTENHGVGSSILPLATNRVFARFSIKAAGTNNTGPFLGRLPEASFSVSDHKVEAPCHPFYAHHCIWRFALLHSATYPCLDSRIDPQAKNYSVNEVCPSLPSEIDNGDFQGSTASRDDRYHAPKETPSPIFLPCNPPFGR
jgi:hypothetical protein